MVDRRQAVRPDRPRASAKGRNGRLHLTASNGSDHKVIRIIAQP